MTSYADSITSAIRDGADLVAWAEPNTAVFNDEHSEAILLAALSGPVDDKMAMGVPLLRFANTDIEAVPLVYGVIANVPEMYRSSVCDQHPENGVFPETSQLLVPMSGSAVVMNVCTYCRRGIDARIHGLIWNG